MAQADIVKVGSEWNACPCCHCSYLSRNADHHPACPVGISEALCHFCATPHSNPHADGCPLITGLYPVLRRELDNNLECASCSEPFTLGQCFCVGKSGIICLTCDWIESSQ